ncbi:carboxylating nicotinate-nucleotide diphosphorylase [Salisediminibacterium beveridgei]|uniref:Probable nicotinate-nucleotide pyrophosphorylase [carboxylating] n=1 Tax=Salisediminibacterium beveridgei TaxID=632773 RepID=A0A1D7QYC9_9BACI|nr:carboxylating nicotinate-nucleotide diphosphorylase [Salisediminibacterium beveridgei]AOM84013.1 Quinolinate phosphoribosyltransferase (decarboxylating) [Salisediminibacterium beveridgei]
MNPLLLEEQLRQFYTEDLGFGDVTTRAIFKETDLANGSVYSKANGVFCGTAVVRACYRLFDPAIHPVFYKHDGDTIRPGEEIFRTEGHISDLLAAERVMLNILQHLSGIATRTRRMVRILEGTGVEIADTRKTTPGLRMLEKYAVKTGGGNNHRLRLDDAAMIKDTHVAAAGSITRAVEFVKQATGHMTRIEVEVESFAQFLEAIHANADVIMIDNTPPDIAKSWLQSKPENITIEYSGNVTEDTLSAIAKSGVDVISAGCLTHTVTPVDMSFTLQEQKEDV